MKNLPQILTILTLGLGLGLLGSVSGCKPEPQRPIPQNIVLTPKESFLQLWAETIQRTESINKKAKEIAREENLRPGAPLPPKRIGITGLPEENPPGEKPLDILYDVTIARVTIPIWIHVGNTTPSMQESYAVAATQNPQTGEIVYYPRTKQTEKKILLTTTNMRTKLIQDQIKRIAKEENIPIPTLQDLKVSSDTKTTNNAPKPKVIW